MKLSGRLVLTILLILTAAVLAVAISALIGLLRPRMNDISAVDRDCTVQAYAWHDTNENGRQDQGEMPLSNVEVLVYANTIEYRVSAVTNPQGEAFLFRGSGWCPDIELTVTARVPDGLHLTTPGRLYVDQHTMDSPLGFGFAYLPGVPTATPRPSRAMTCAVHPWPPEVEHSRVKSILAAPDGTVWGIAWIGVFHFDPASEIYTVYTERSGLPSSWVDALTVAPGGIVWAATYEGIASFDGSSWTKRSEGFKTSNVVNLFPFGNDIWIVTSRSAYKLDPSNNQLVGYPLGGDASIDYAAMAPDGTIWGVSSPCYLSQLVFSPTPRWISHPSGLIKGVDGFAISPDDTLWIVGGTRAGEGLARFDPQTGEWVAYDYSTTKGAIIDDYFSSLAAAPDGSLWLGTWHNGAVEFVPGKERQPDDAEVIYYVKEELVGIEAIQTIALAPDGAVWFGIADKIIRCTLK